MRSRNCSSETRRRQPFGRTLIGALHCERFVDKAPALMTYLAYRILEERGHEANQVWSASIRGWLDHRESAAE